LVMDVLCALAQQPGEMLSRDSLISLIWYFNPSADESLTRAISILRKVFRADSEGQPYIETVWKRGYRLLAPVFPQLRDSVKIFAPGNDHVLSSAGARSEVASFSVAVLRFNMLPLSPDDAFLSDGFTRDLTALLSRVPRLRVAAYNTAVRYDGSEASTPALCTALGVRYLVSGSMTRVNGQVQLRVAVMDGFTDSQLWSKRIDAPLNRILDLRDGLVLDISTSILSEMRNSEAAAVEQNTSFNVDAYAMVQYAEALRERYGQEAAEKIVQTLERALEIEPGNATVRAALATQLTQNVVSRFSKTPSETFARARVLIDEALKLDANDPEVLTAAGIVATMMGNARLAVRQLTRAIQRDPNNAHALAVLGWQSNWLNGDRAGIAMIETAERRAPHHPRYALWAYYRGHCEVKLGRLEAAVAAYRTSIDRNPNYHLTYVSLASVLAVLNRDDEAAEAIARALALVPDYTSMDYQILAERMIYMFGARPGRDEVLGCLHEVWRHVAAPG
jgi:TolB-like protein/Flp pilus assembly protein TadD